MYVPRKSNTKRHGINNDDGNYEGLWYGPIILPLSLIRKSHNTSHLTPVARGYELKPIRVQRLPDSDRFQIVDGNKRRQKAIARHQSTITAFIFAARLPVPEFNAATKKSGHEQEHDTYDHKVCDDVCYYIKYWSAFLPVPSHFPPAE